MNPIGYHVTIRLEDDRPLLTSARSRRSFAQLVYRNGSHRGLLGFRAADTHAHFLFRSGRRDAGQAIRCIEIALQRSLCPGASFESARLREVRDQHHLRNTLRYLWRQEHHHRIALDPFHDASSLPELLGLRCLPESVGWEETTSRARESLPRLRRGDLFLILRESAPNAELLWSSASGDPPPRLADGQLRDGLAFAVGELADDRVTDAIAAAVGVANLDGRDVATRRARAGAFSLLSAAYPLARLASILAASTRTLQRLRMERPLPELLEAIRGQLTLRRPPPSPQSASLSPSPQSASLSASPSAGPSASPSPESASPSVGASPRVQ